MPRLADRRTTIIVALMATSLAGCAPEMAGLRQSFAHPGPAAYQRAQAIQHDPYVLNDVGPEVVGGRPREYHDSSQRSRTRTNRRHASSRINPDARPSRSHRTSPRRRPHLRDRASARRAAVSPRRPSNRHNSGPGRSHHSPPNSARRISVLLSLRERISSRRSVMTTLSDLATVNPSLRVVSW